MRLERSSWKGHSDHSVTDPTNTMSNQWTGPMLGAETMMVSRADTCGLNYGCNHGNGEKSIDFERQSRLIG